MRNFAFSGVLQSYVAVLCCSRNPFLARVINKFSMMSTSFPVRLVCLQRSHPDIPLPDGITVNIGRSPATKITDPRCSRNQVALTADWSKKKVRVQQLGGNPSSVDGELIGPKKELNAVEEATIFILEGQYPHKVVFGEEIGKKPASTVTEGIKKVKGKSESKDRSHSSEKIVKEKNMGRTRVTKRAAPSSTDLVEAKKRKTSEENGSLGQDKASEEVNLDLVQSKLDALKKDVKKDSSRKKSSTEEVPSPSSTPSPTPPVAKENAWTQHDQLHVFTAKGVQDKKKIASFDVDGTIIFTKSGRTFAANADDWKIAYPEIFGKMKQLLREDFKLVFFTNQLGVSKGQVRIEDLKKKLENIVAKLQVPIQIFIATDEGRYRKPADGMWKKLIKQYNGGVAVDNASSVFVGDAAGRAVNWEPKRKKDFSCGDRLYAMNIGVEFHTPEEFFLGKKKAPFSMPPFDPTKIPTSQELIQAGGKLTSDKKEVIVLVGFPASGKSHLAKHHLKPKGYVVVNRDTLGTWQKCVKFTNESLVNSSVVVDNTNMSQDERARYVDCAKAANVPCRCFVMTTTFEHCKHNEKFRKLTDTQHAKISRMVFNMARSRYQAPTLGEGFSEIVNVNFVPKFSSPSLAAEYKKYLVEK